MKRMKYIFVVVSSESILIVIGGVALTKCKGLFKKTLAVKA